MAFLTLCVVLLITAWIISSLSCWALGPLWFPSPPISAPRRRALAWRVAFLWAKGPCSPSQKQLYPLVRAFFDHLCLRWFHRLPHRETWRRLHRLASALPHIPWNSLTGMGPSSSLSGLTPFPLTPAVVENGLGRRGCFPIPAHIWSRYVTPALEQALLTFHLPDCPPLKPLTARMLQVLYRDSFLHPTDRPPTLHAFLRPKTATKVAFIAHLPPTFLYPPFP